MSSKRKNSSIWKHFNKGSSKIARCKYCLTLIRIAQGSNGNLINHLKTKHPSIILKIERRPKPDLNSRQSSESTSQSVIIISPPPNTTEAVSHQSPNQYIRKVEEINNQVVKMIAKGHHSVQILKEIEFRKLIELVSQCPGYKLPSRETLSDNFISRLYNVVTDEVKKKLQAASALSLSTDAWTSRNNESYIAIVAHFVDEDTKLQSVLLDCINYNERHTSQNLCDFMKNVMAEWHISDKVEAIVSDNDANILAAIKLGKWRSISCFAHSLNLVIQEAMKKISDLLAKVRNIVEFFNRSTQAKEKLIATQQKMNLPILKLKQDVQTRWNSTFDMLQRLLQMKDALIATVALLCPELTLNEKDWKIIEEVLTLFSPFYEITEEIIAEKYVTLSKVMKFCCLLNTFINKHASINKKIVAVQSVLIEGMDNRFKDLESNVLYAVCTFLDPRFKTKCIINKKVIINAEQLNRIINNGVQLFVKRDIRHIRNISLAIPTSSDSALDVSSNRNQRASIWDEHEEKFNNITDRYDPLGATDRELNKYFNENLLDRKQDPLQWWHERRQFYPRIHAYILQIFSIVTTTVPCERVFTATGEILNERRAMLSTNKVSELVFLHNNM